MDRICRFRLYKKPLIRKVTNPAVNFDIDVFVKFKQANNKTIISGYNFKFNPGNEFNQHQKRTWSNPTPEQFFLDLQNVGFTIPLFQKNKIIYSLEAQNLKIFEKVFRKKPRTLLTLYGYMSGNTISGAQKNKINHPLVCDFNEKQIAIWQFLRILSTKKIKLDNTISLSSTTAINIEEFIEGLSEEEKDIFNNNFLDNKIKFFYIAEWKKILDNIDKATFRDAQFTQTILDKYKLEKKCDFVYGKLENSYLVESAHIIPVGAKKAKEFKEVNLNSWKNGLLLPVHIHKLFDNGAIYIDSSTGKIKFSSKTEYQIKADEKKTLNLEDISIDKKYIKDKEELINWHKDNIFEVGVQKYIASIK